MFRDGLAVGSKMESGFEQTLFEFNFNNETRSLVSSVRHATMTFVSKRERVNNSRALLCTRTIKSLGTRQLLQRSVIVTKNPHPRPARVSSNNLKNPTTA